VPAVWHKEILWAMTRGIHVFGAASMGALRAAELAPFGMEGVGAIFQAYRNGILKDDDEVAVAHTTAESGYRCSSEAMVNIRRTLAAAESAGVISRGTHLELAHFAKQLFYPERTYPGLLDLARDELPSSEIEALRAWLPQGRADQKREDALALLGVMRERLAGGLSLKPVRFSFEYTAYWDRMQRATGASPSGPNDELALLPELLLEELRIAADVFQRARAGAMLRFFELESARRHGVKVPVDMIQLVGDTFRSDRGLLHADDVEEWSRDNDLRPGGFAQLMDEEAQRRRIEALFESSALDHVQNYLRVTGEYSRLVARAREKQRMLESRGQVDPSAEALGLTEECLWSWYFEERLHRPVVPDLAAYAHALGFSHVEALRRAVLREFCYVSQAG
jgi:hypothetical protein